MKTRILIFIGVFASMSGMLPYSNAFFEEGIVVEFPLQTMEIKKINGLWYYVSEPIKPDPFVDRISFQEVEFSPPYRYDPPRHTFVDVVFSDGVQETIDILHHLPAFTEHVNPQAGFVGKTDGYSFMVSVNLQELSPMKQTKLGIAINEIRCKDGLVQVFKKTDNSPACVSLETKAKLIQRGWAESSGNIVKQRTVQPGHSPKLISKSLATFYAAEQRDLTEEDLKKYDSRATLLKIKNNGFAFEVDPNTLEERDLYMNRFNEYGDGQYIWLVSLVKNKEYQYHINATDGKILLSAQDGTVLTRPHEIENEN